jgi:RNA polymerase-associated protein CTR9
MLSNVGNDRKTEDQILKLFEVLLKRNPNNVIALVGKARMHYGRKQYAIALRLYQKAMTARPDMQPDPRIGIGQCFWHLKMKKDARAAWERALELVPRPQSIKAYGSNPAVPLQTCC